MKSLKKLKKRFFSSKKNRSLKRDSAVRKAKTRKYKRYRGQISKINAFLGSMFDEEWYRNSAQVEVPANQSALSYYLTVGVPQRHAPCPALAAPDSVHMVSWLKDQLDRIEAPFETQTESRHIGRHTSRELAKPETFKNPSRKKLAVYSANFGSYDITEPIDTSWTQYADFYCFTDGTSQIGEGWTLVSPSYFNIEPRRSARFYKLHPHLFFSEYEWSLWIDANIALTHCPMKIVEGHLEDGAQIVTIKHPARGCVYQEAFVCALREKDEPRAIVDQVNRYLTGGYPPMNGMIESGVMLRRHGDASVIDLMRRWWGEIERGSARDQLSFNYCLSKSPGVSLGFFPESSVRDSPRFRLEKHMPG